MSTYAEVEGQPVDGQGNPLVKVGCSNCGKGVGWMDALEFSALRNAGHDPCGPCSRSCELQLEHERALRVGAVRHQNAHLRMACQALVDALARMPDAGLAEGDPRCDWWHAAAAPALRRARAALRLVAEGGLDDR